MVLAETIFAWPGIGQYAYQSVTNLDFPSITAVALLIAVNYVLINLMVDISYGVVDPRVRYK
jgi:peptide/nickel transport system permease protein